MSRNFSIIVLCPNGRRETLKMTNNSSILQILEEACVKQNLNPVDFDIYHYQKPLDLSLPVRFANLPNNALLELRPTKNIRKECMVNIALQLESNERLIGEFTPSSTLLDVLKKCLGADSVQSEQKGEPVCIYMHQKISGDSIKSTTLRSLGLTKGTAIIRLLYRKPVEWESQAHISNPLVAHSNTEEMSVSVAPYNPTITLSDKTESFEKLTNEIQGTNETDKTQKNELSSNTAHKDPNDNVSQIIPVTETSTFPIKYEDVCENIANEHEIKMECDVDVKQNSKETNSVKYTNEVNEMEHESCVKQEVEEIGNINYIGERHAVLYSLDDVTEIKKADLPDEFFELTINDVRYLMDQYTKERIQMENQPLLTKERREKMILQKLGCYNETVIRVYFPERLVLQAVFKVTETVQTVCDFIKGFLENKDLKFYLYITPPKEKLVYTKTLLESMLVPAAVVYFGCEAQLPSYLASNLRSMKSDPRAASLAAFESRKKNLSNIQQSSSQSEHALGNIENSMETVSSSTNEFHQPQIKKTKAENIPKWMKLSKK